MTPGERTLTTAGTAPRTAASVERGAAIGDWRVGELLAEGGQAVVYRAEHASRGSPAALKILREGIADSAEMLARFSREIDVVRAIRHPAMVEIYDVGRLPDGRPWFAMELLEGRDLSAVLGERRRLTAGECVRIIEPVCAALAAAHAIGVVHRDVKASNVFVTVTQQVKLLDFGIAKLLAPAPRAERLTTAGERLGTIHAMAPEQIAGGAIDARTDVYALGVLLYQMLAGVPPFLAEDAFDLERMHLSVPAAPPSRYAAIPPQLDAIVLRCLEKAPERRFSGVSELVSALRAIVSFSGAVAPVVRIRVRIAATGDIDDDRFVLAHSAWLDLLEAQLVSTGFSLPIRTTDLLLAERPATAALSALADARRIADSARLSAADPDAIEIWCEEDGS